MAKRNRITLKQFFQRGALPTESQFHDLIDSNLNMVDEGFDRSAEYGVEISPLGDKPTLLSFYRDQQDGKPAWTIRHDEKRENLLVEVPGEAPTLSVAPGHRVGINKPNPLHELDVDGIVASHGRMGVQGRVLANGQWHVIVGGLSGCHAFEVVAGTGKKRTGHYALMHAFAVNAFNPRGWFFNFLNLKRRITYHQAYYRSMRSKLKLRWRPADTRAGLQQHPLYQLELRSNFDFGPEIYIQYNITRLWFDDFMAESQPEVKTP